VNAGDRVIEIGFGNGREIPRVLSLSADVTYFGIDISDTMVADAAEFNADVVRQGRVTVARGASAAIAADANTFDKALAINTIYFWSDPSADLKEIRRVLRSDGRLVLGALAPWSAVGRAVFQHGFRLYEKSEIENLLASARFTKYPSTQSTRLSCRRWVSRGIETISLLPLNRSSRPRLFWCAARVS